jgi:hypothetical protein
VRKTSKPSKEITIRSSVAEYLTFAIASQEQGVEVRYENENIWASQKMMAELYGVEVNTINYHLKQIFSDKELDENSVIRNFRITASDGKNYNTKHYSLEAITAVGYKVSSSRAVQFRKWATTIIKEFTVKAYVMDDERIKNSGSILTKEYFKKMLQRIREIRLSERMFYQQITDIYATAIDYDKSSKTTNDFFATVQNKLHWAIHKHTAAELIMERANAKKANMGLVTWEDAPNGKIQKFDVSIAKNYLSKEELSFLARYVSMYLDHAEAMAMRHIPMTMEDWAKRLDVFLQLNECDILTNPGKVSREIAKTFAESEFEKYRLIQDKTFKSDFDLEVMEELKKLDNQNEQD